MVCSAASATDETSGPPPLCYPEFIFPDPVTGVTTATLRVEIQRNVLDSDPVHHIALTSRVYVVVGQDRNGTQTAPGDGACRQRGTAGRRLTGPTLVVVPGGALNITIVNALERIGQHAPNRSNLRSRLPGLASASINNATVPGHREIAARYARAEHENHWHKINTTNLHTHGLHADPSIDDPFRRIAGGESGHYWLPILPDEPAPAMHWYHTHIHGATALQMMGGLFGMLLVEPSPTAQSASNLVGGQRPRSASGQQRDGAPAKRAGSNSPDRSFKGHASPGAVIAPTNTTLLGRVCDAMQRHTLAIHTMKFTSKHHPSPYSGWSFGDLDAALHNNVASAPTVDVDILAVNGQFQPTITMILGTPVVLHLVFASAFGEAHLEVPPTCLAAVVGADGVSYPRPRRLLAHHRLHLVTATRLDVVMQCEALGVTRIVHHTGRFDDASYLRRAKRLGMEHNVVMTIRVVGDAADDGGRRRQPNLVGVGVDRGTARWPVLEHLATEHRDGDRDDLRVGGDEDLRHAAAIDLHWDLSMSQVQQHRTIANASALYAATNAVAPRDLSDSRPHAAPPPPPPLPYVYAIGTGPNCAPSSMEGDGPGAPRNCTFEAFSGPHGAQRPADYRGFVVPLGGVVEARLYTDPMDDRPHPLHFHVNHFQVIRYAPPTGTAGNAAGRGADALLSTWGIAVGEWRDTIPVLPGTTVIRWRAADYAGEIVYHCHTLSHEDLGMMGSYLVRPPSLLSPATADATSAALRQPTGKGTRGALASERAPYTSWGPFAVVLALVALVVAWGCYIVPRRRRVMRAGA